MSGSAGRTAWQLAFETSPIILSGGVAQFMPFGMIPLNAITEAINFPLGLLSGGNAVDPNRYFAHFAPLPGTSLISQRVGKYPFANQSVAANAVIVEPTRVSMLMTCPVQNEGGYFERLAVIEALVATLQQHNQSGGTYTIATPAKIFLNCVMNDMRDTSNPQTKQPMNSFTLDFEKPLLTLEQAASALNSLFNQITAATGLNLTGAAAPAAAGLSQAVGQTVASGGPAIIPAATSSVAASTITVTPLPPLPQ